MLASVPQAAREPAADRAGRRRRRRGAGRDGSRRAGSATATGRLLRARADGRRRVREVLQSKSAEEVALSLGTCASWSRPSRRRIRSEEGEERYDEPTRRSSKPSRSSRSTSTSSMHCSSTTASATTCRGSAWERRPAPSSSKCPCWGACAGRGSHKCCHGSRH